MSRARRTPEGDAWRAIARAIESTAIMERNTQYVTWYALNGGPCAGLCDAAFHAPVGGQVYGDMVTRLELFRRGSGHWWPRTHAGAAARIIACGLLAAIADAGEPLP